MTRLARQVAVLPDELEAGGQVIELGALQRHGMRGRHQGEREDDREPGGRDAASEAFQCPLVRAGTRDRISLCIGAAH